MSECRNGHTRTKENTWIDKNGYSNCRICISIANTKHNKTEKRKISQKNYADSEYGHEQIRKKNLRLSRTPKYIEKRLERNGTDAMRIIRKRYNDKYRVSDYGKLVIMNRNFARWNFKLKGICSECGSKEYTERHHTEYNDPPRLEDIIELCLPCHTKKRLIVA